jgi:hypothetical protein
MNFRKCCVGCAMLVALACASMLHAAPAKPAPVMSSRDLAVKAYAEGRYTDAVGMLLGPAEANAEPGPQAENARELLARCWVRLADPIRARSTFFLILRDQPDYRPDPQKLKPDEIQAFNTALGDFRSGRLRPEARPEVSVANTSRSSFCGGADFGLGVNVGTPSFRGLELGGYAGVEANPVTAVVLDVRRLGRARDIPATESLDQHEDATAVAVAAELRRVLRRGGGGPKLIGLVGAGPLLGVSYHIGTASAPLGERTDTGTGFDAHGGIEACFPLGGADARIVLVGRYARANLVPETAGDSFKLTLSGVALTVGIGFSGR